MRATRAHSRLFIARGSHDCGYWRAKFANFTRSDWRARACDLQHFRLIIARISLTAEVNRRPMSFALKNANSPCVQGSPSLSLGFARILYRRRHRSGRRGGPHIKILNNPSYLYPFAVATLSRLRSVIIWRCSLSRFSFSSPLQLAVN